MSNLSADIENLKKSYREIFLKTSEEFSKKLEEVETEDISKFLNEDILKEVWSKWSNLLEQRNSFKCSGCGACCKLACSEFSPKELIQKAKNGDNFATQFTRVFIPYEKEEDAQKVYPEYFNLLKLKGINENNGEKTYFYHCPKVTNNNRCPDYENRPQICKDFPDNPIGLLPKTCGFSQWKEEVKEEALRLHAMLEIVYFYKNRI